MIGTRKDFLSFVMILTGLVVLGLAYVRRGAAPRTDPSLGTVEALPLSFADLERDFLLEQPLEQFEGILALFVLHTRVCPPCLNETSEFARLLSESAEPPIRSLALVVERDASRAERFLGTTALPISAGYGHPPWLGELLAFEEDGGDGPPQQLVFVDAADEMLFYRRRLPNALTDIDHKHQVLKRMLATYRSLEAP